MYFSYTEMLWKLFHKTELCFPRYYTTPLQSTIEHKMFEKSQKILQNLVRKTLLKSRNFIFQNYWSPKERLAGNNIFAYFRKVLQVKERRMAWKCFNQGLTILFVKKNYWSLPDTLFPRNIRFRLMS